MTTALLAEPQVGFHSLSLRPELLASLDRAGYQRTDPHSGRRHPGSPRRTRRSRPGPDRHRQDRRLSSALHERLARRRPARPPGHHPGPDARTGRAGRRGGRQALSQPQLPDRGHLRRPTLPRAAHPAAARAGHRRRHARPGARPPVARHAVAGERPLPRPRRGRPDARHRLPARHRTHPAPLPVRAANAAAVGHAAAARPAAGPALHDRSGQHQPVAGQDHRRKHPPVVHHRR